MSPISKTPEIGQKLIYVNRSKGLHIGVRVTKVFGAVCEVETLVPMDLRTECSTLKVHMALLFNV